MAEHKGKGTKGRLYDELSGVGTSQAGITGTTGNLNTHHRDGGVGMPGLGDAGNRQNADRGEHGDTPALGGAGRGHESRQSAVEESLAPGENRAGEEPGDDNTLSDNPNLPGSGRTQKR
jgi:hypothetical protein